VDHFYVALNRSHLGGMSGPGDIADLFGMDRRSLRDAFAVPVLLARLAISDLYRVDRRTPPDSAAAVPVRIRYPM
jgi:hypothetical protein